MQPFQQLCGQPFHNGGAEHTGKEQIHRLGAQVGIACRQQHRRGAVDKAERAGGRTAVGKALALDGGDDRLTHPAQEGIYQVNNTQRIEVQCHKKTSFRFPFVFSIVPVLPRLHKGMCKILCSG